MGPTGCKILAVQFIHYFAQDTQLSKSCYANDSLGGLGDE